MISIHELDLRKFFRWNNHNYLLVGCDVSLEINHQEYLVLNVDTRDVEVLAGETMVQELSNPPEWRNV